MGSILSEEASIDDQKNYDKQSIKMIKNWQVLERTNQKEILKSKKTSLIVQRYWFQMENYQDVQSQNKLFQWRNNNPNSQFMINVLSVGKDQLDSERNSSECCSIQWCPPQKMLAKVYVVTQRILKLGEINEVVKFQKQMEYRIENNKTKILYATQQNVIIPYDNKKSNKILPFINIKFSQGLARQLLKDWIRGIQVLCYKFGYFKITENHLGVKLQKRGTVWISDNYSQNHLSSKTKIQVTTAEQKFKYQKQTIQDIFTLIQNIHCFRNIIAFCKQNNVQRFDQFCLALDQMNKINKIIQPQIIYQPQIKNNNISLYVQQGSFLGPGNLLAHNNSSFFIFDHQNALKRVNSNQRMNSDQKIIALQGSLKKKISKKLLNSGNSTSLQNKEIKRSNTGEKIIKNLSPQSKQQLALINSNHKYCGKQTAPTNQLGHSSSLQSVNHINNIKGHYEDVNMNRVQGKTMFKSQNNDKLQGALSNECKMYKPSSSSSKKVYFHHQNCHSFSSQPYIFRSQANDFKSPKSPKPNENINYNNALVNNNYSETYHNYSLDQHNIVGPYRKDRFYSNLKKQKIMLVDSMVMVRQQSEQIQQDLHNLSRGKYVMQESIILMGKDEDAVLSQVSQ